MDFPGYDNAQRHGWDGWIEAGAATPWVPEGKSGWEFGVDQRPGAKADRDFQARLNTISPAERAESAFVFVTPRNWEGKDCWARGKEAAGDWKAVRALDASDLEQWLETTIAPRIWLAEELEIPTEGFETLGRSWRLWAEASDPPLTPAIFGPSVAAHVKDFKKWLETARPDRPFTVAADSRDEAVAFVACLLRHEDVTEHDRDRAVVFTAASTLRTLAQSSSPFMPIVHSEETEREIATLYRHRHCIVVRPRNAVDRESDVAVELLSHPAFEEALADMGIERGRFDRLASESGRSPTVLRRRLSRVPAVRTPRWAGDEAAARRLIPISLVGAWHSGSRTDAEVLEALARGPYREVEKSIATLLQRDDCPVWRVDLYRGVVSRIDALFAVGRWMTAEDIVNFLGIAEYVLSECDPPLAVPEDLRLPTGRPPYAHAPGAKFFGQMRRYSDALRTGVCETLMLLSVHGNDIFRDGLGLDVPALVSQLVQRLLGPLEADNLLRHYENLPGFAEAAPDEFLVLLEEDLRRPKPVLHELLRPAGPGSFANPVRTAVLWSLERLAWHPKTLMRVVVILAELSQTKIDDSYASKPMNSLSAIFRARMPQTAAPLEDRIDALGELCRRFPDVGWRVCIQQFERRHEVVSPSARPRWRNDAAGAGHLLPGREPYEFARKALDLAISRTTHDGTTLGDLVERLGGMTDADRSSVWERIDVWSRSERSDKEKAELRERIRRAVFTRWGHPRGLEAAQKNNARKAREQLTPHDPVVRHGWLFSDAWVEESVDDAHDAELDTQEQAARIRELRTKAMMEIWSARGCEGALAMLSECEPWVVGYYSANCAADRDEETEVLRECLSNKAVSKARLDEFLRGFIGYFDNGARSALITTLAETTTADQTVRLYTCAPFRERTWRLLDGQKPQVRNRYWRAVPPTRDEFEESEVQEIVDRFLEVGRSRDAFSAVQFYWDKVETSRLKRLLMALQAEFAGDFGVDFYRLSEALQSLDGRPGVTPDEMTQLEFAFVEALDPLSHARHGIPNIERKLGESPLFFIQVLALIYERKDSGRDPQEWRVGDVDSRFFRRSAAYRVLAQVTRLPGADAERRVDTNLLVRWVTEVRRLCKEHGRADIGDQKIGELLSRAPFEDDGSWPCRAVCEVLETIASDNVFGGFESSTRNARSGVMRPLDELGAQERELSGRYRTWARRWRFEYPRVARILERVAAGHDGHAEWVDSRLSAMDRLEH